RRLRPLLSGYQHARGIAGLPHHAVLEDAEVRRADDVRNALLDLPAPERRRHLAPHAIEAIEDGGILPDEREGQAAGPPQDAVQLRYRADNILRREQLQQVTADHRVE